MTTIETKHGTLMVVPVLKDTLKTAKHMNGFKPFELLVETESGNRSYIGIDTDFEILGTCTSTEISFDVEPYVDNLSGKDDYRNYVDDQHDQVFSVASDSFRSLLASYGIYFTNPCGEEPKRGDFDKPGVSKIAGDNIWLEAMNLWEEAQSKVINKAVIIRVK